MGSLNPEQALETMVNCLLYLNISFVCISVFIESTPGILFSVINTSLLLLRNGIKSKAELIKTF